MIQAGKVEAIFLAGVHGEQPRRVEVAVGHPGQGLEGDRNFGDEVRLTSESALPA